MKGKNIRDGVFAFTELIDRQLLTEENAKFLFPYIGKQIMAKIKDDRMIIPHDNVIAYVRVTFCPEKEYEKRAFPWETSEEFKNRV
jgi:hypothetical protein